jgi:protein Tex
MLEPIEVRIASELGVQPRQVQAAVSLLDEKATVPFIARYRKEATGGLDDTQLRKLAERLIYLRELETRRAAILASVQEQGKLSDALRAAIEHAQTKVELEDQYLPYRPKRRSKATIAQEAGLEPLASALLADPSLDPLQSATGYVDAENGVADAAAALEGARAILIERFAEDAGLLAQLREWCSREAVLVSEVRAGKAEDAEAQRFRDYFAHAEPLARVPGHRALAMLRARNEDVVDLRLGIGPEREPLSQDPGGEGLRRIAARFGLAARGRPADEWLAETARQCFRYRLASGITAEAIVQMRERSETEAIEVFAANLRDLLLAAPAGPRTILGLDPGLRTGCKVAAVDRTGKLLGTTTIYPHAPRNDWSGSLATLDTLCEKLGIELIAIGNGTASRETDKLVTELIRQRPAGSLRKLVVSEAGASVYSASERASEEFPQLDVSLRGAVSIARRLQDPLAELVKIEPKAIGVGQYQHDVNQTQLARALDGVVEDCVNHVGVDLNTASVDLLAHVAGLGPTLAKNIVSHRDQHGAFRTRRQLLEVARLGPKAFEQCAGFLRIRDGDDPLDCSAVHPEAYPVVERILSRCGRPIGDVLADRDFLRGLDPRTFTDERFGLPTVTDILAELEKPGRDPRPEFKTASFQEGVQELSDLRPGMQLEGVITNVTNFGAFVDVGVHQDGLVHISQLSDRFVRDPREVVKAGQIVHVRVLEVDAARRRIALTMKRGERPEPAPRDPAARADRPDRPGRPTEKPRGERGGAGPRKPEPVYPLAAQLAKLKRPKD